MTDRRALSDRVAACERMLRDAARDAGMAVSGDGRVCESFAAKLLGYTHGGLKHMREEGRAPRHFRIGVGNSRLSYRIADLAMWIEGALEEA